MKFNISNPTTGQNLPLVVDDEKKLLAFYGKRMGQEVPGDVLGDGWKNYILKITGGNDKDGFPMKQGIPLQGRTRLLMCEGHSTYRPRRNGERKKKSVRGCIVGADLAVLALTVVRQGDAPVEGLTNDKKPRRRGPKRATRVRKLFALNKEDDERRYVLLYSRKIEKNGKAHWKTARIQRLVTSERLRRKRLFREEKKHFKVEAKQARDYLKLIRDVKRRNRNRRAHEIGVAKAAERAAKGEPAPTKTTKTAATKAPAGKQAAGKAPATTQQKGGQQKPATQQTQQKPATQQTQQKPAQTQQKPTTTAPKKK